jgi:hypothetical protein
LCWKKENRHVDKPLTFTYLYGPVLNLGQLVRGLRDYSMKIIKIK